MTADDRDAETVTVRVPDELPVLTPETSRILLAILIELTEVEAPDGPPGEWIT
jgi:hypothetical protein